jgi:hypothetical protein
VAVLTKPIRALQSIDIDRSSQVRSYALGRKVKDFSFTANYINLPPRRTIVLHCGEQGLSKHRGGATKPIRALQTLI